MFENHVACDVPFVIGKQRQEVTEHKYVLISRSSVFYAMLCGLLQETRPIHIPDVEPEVFEQLLRYVYFEAFEPDGDSILALLYAAKKYAVESLVDKCVNWLKDGVSIENVCSILQQAHTLDEKDLRSKCLEFIIENGSAVLKQPSFRNLSSECVEMVVKQDDLWIEEEEVYEAMKGWAGNECARKKIQPSAENMRHVLGGLKNLIRFSMMDGKYFAEKVATDNILTADEKVSMFQTFFSIGNLNNTEFIQTKKKPRFQEKQRVIRFQTCGDPVAVGSIIHAVDFKCSKEVLLHGILIYGAMQTANYYRSNADYGISYIDSRPWAMQRINYAMPEHVVRYNQEMPHQQLVPAAFVSDIEVQLLDESKHTIVSMKRQITITEQELLEILFDEPVVLWKKWYTITLVISNSGTTKTGVNGETVVSLGDGQTIEFRDSLLSASHTNAFSGQIPGLLLSRRR